MMSICDTRDTTLWTDQSEMCSCCAMNLFVWTYIVSVCWQEIKWIAYVILIFITYTAYLQCQAILHVLVTALSCRQWRLQRISIQFYELVKWVWYFVVLLCSEMLLEVITVTLYVYCVQMHYETKWSSESWYNRVTVT